MRVVLDTNVVGSGVFFGGVPGQILSAWNDGLFTLVISLPILAEYREVGAELSSKSGGNEFEEFAALLVLNSTIVDAVEYFEASVCADPDDDKFLACALAGHARVIVSGDKHLLDVSGWSGVEVLRPRDFLEKYLGGS